MKNKSIRIIGKTPPPIGGVSIHIDRLYKNLLEDKSFDVYLTDFNKFDNFSIILFMLKKFFLGFKERVVHYQLTNLYFLVFVYLISKLHFNKNKIVYTIHGEGFALRFAKKKIVSRAVFRYVFNNIDCIVADNTHLIEQLRGVGIKNKKCRSS